MRKLISAVCAISLLTSGCKTVTPDTGLATQVQIPPIPANLAVRAGNLPKNEDTSMGGQVLDNTNNIRQYNSKAQQVNDLIDLYNCVRDSINNKKETKCL